MTKPKEVRVNAATVPEKFMRFGPTGIPQCRPLGKWAAKLGIQRRTMRKYLARGEFPRAFVPPGSTLTLIPESDISDFMARHNWAQNNTKRTE